MSARLSMLGFNEIKSLNGLRSLDAENNYSGNHHVSGYFHRCPSGRARRRWTFAFNGILPGVHSINRDDASFDVRSWSGA